MVVIDIWKSIVLPLYGSYPFTVSSFYCHLLLILVSFAVRPPYEIIPNLHNSQRQKEASAQTNVRIALWERSFFYFHYREKGNNCSCSFLFVLVGGWMLSSAGGVSVWLA